MKRERITPKGINRFVAFIAWTCIGICIVFSPLMVPGLPLDVAKRLVILLAIAVIVLAFATL